MGGAVSTAARPHPPPLPTRLALGKNAEERLLTLGAAEGWEGRFVGLGTDLVSTLVAPVPGILYVLNKYLLVFIKYLLLN